MSGKELEKEFELKEQYALFFKGMKDAVYIYSISEDGVIGPLLDFNESAVRFLGYTPSELSRLNPADIVPQKYRSMHPLFTTPPKALTNTIFETVHVTRSGELIPVEVNIVPKVIDGMLIVCSIARDISDRKRLEETILREKEKSERYLSAPGVIFLALDTAGKIMMMNRSGCELFGYEFSEVIDDNGMVINNCESLGMDWFDQFIPHSIREEMQKYFNEVIAERLKQYEHYENEVLCKDGSVRLVNWHNTILRDENGSVIGSFSSGMDVTDRRRTEKELELAKSEVALALIEGQERERQRIAVDLHDSIQPLLSTAFRRIEVLESEWQELNPENVNNTHKISDLLDQTLKEIKAISYNLYPPSLRDFGLKAALEERCKAMNSVKGPKIKFYGFDVDGRLNNRLEIHLYRIAQELLNNALKHARADVITLQLVLHHDKLVLMVEDDGKGMDVQNSKKGMGINGMSARLKALGGNYEFDSQKGKGTTVTVEVPLKR